MNRVPKDMQVGCKHQQKDGEVTIVSYNSYNDVLVSFCNGYEVSVQAGQIRKGNVKNRMLPTVFGVGYIGKGVHKSCSGKGGSHSKMYQDWINMIGRCYSPDRLKLYPSYSECTVYEPWFNFQVFGDWYVDNYPKDGGEYHLDKDILSSGEKIYSPETCSFVSPFDNYQKAHAKRTKLVSPSGEVVNIYNVSKFCREKKLSQSAINDVTIGRRKSYKGWERFDDQP